MNELLSSILLLLVIIDPLNMVFIVTLLSKDFHFKDIQKVIMKCNLIALILLILFSFFGTFILKDVFHIDINSLRIAGGIILAAIGKNQLEKGQSFSIEREEEITEIATTPLAIPFIAGPAAIATVITLSHTNIPLALIATILAIAINTVLMLIGMKFVSKIKKYMSPLIRVFGLFIMSIGIQMIVQGIKLLFFT